MQQIELNCAQKGQLHSIGPHKGGRIVVDSWPRCRWMDSITYIMPAAQTELSQDRRRRTTYATYYTRPAGFAFRFASFGCSASASSSQTPAYVRTFFHDKRYGVVIMLWVFSTEDRTAVVVLANRTVCLHCMQWSIGTYHSRDELSSIMFMVGPQLQYNDVHWVVFIWYCY